MVLAQHNLATQQVRKLFSKPKKIKWVRHYTGQLDQTYEVSISIGYDGKRCKGRLIYAGSQELFMLEGTLSGSQINLKEKDKNDQVSAFITGTIDKTSIQAVWKNTKKEIHQTLTLRRAPSPLGLIADCSSKHWIRQYRYKAYHLLIQHPGNENYTGYVSLPGQVGTFYFKNIAEASPGKLLFELLDAYGKPKGYLQPGTQVNGIWTFNFIKPSGQSQSIPFKLEDQLSIDCAEHADYLSSFDITYPKTSSPSFNQWIRTLAGEWITSCQEYTSVVSADVTNYRPEMRAALRAYAWTDISFFENKLISGQLLYEKNWGDNQGRSFIYDLNVEKELTEKDLFIPAFPRRALLWEKLKNTLPNFPLYVDKGFRSWMENNDFPHLSLNAEGLCFQTEFDLIYGQQTLLILYEEVLPYLRKDSPVAALARRK